MARDRAERLDRSARAEARRKKTAELVADRREGIDSFWNGVDKITGAERRRANKRERNIGRRAVAGAAALLAVPTGMGAVELASAIADHLDGDRAAYELDASGDPVLKAVVGVESDGDPDTREPSSYWDAVVLEAEQSGVELTEEQTWMAVDDSLRLSGAEDAVVVPGEVIHIVSIADNPDVFNPVRGLSNSQATMQGGQPLTNHSVQP